MIQITFVFLMWWSWGTSLPGPDDCVATVRVNQSTLNVVYVPNGTVCFECVFGGVVASEAMFQIANSNIDPSKATVVDGTLVVFDSGAVFNTDAPISVRCNNTNLVLVLYEIFRPPVIRGNTTVDEGDTLSLECDSSNSAPLPTVYWLSPDGEMISNSRDLMISNITRDMAGTYICVAISGNTGATMNATVNVIVYNIPPTEMETVYIQITGPDESITESGAVIILRCQLLPVTAFVLYVWTREEGDLPQNSIQDDNGTLVIPDTQESDSGVYTCTANGVTGNITLRIIAEATNTASATGDPCSWAYAVVVILTIIILALAGLSVVLLLKQFSGRRGTNQKMGEEQCHMDTNVAYGTHRDVIMIRGN